MTPGYPNPATTAGWGPTNVNKLLIATTGIRSAVTLPGSLPGNPAGTPDMVMLAGPAMVSSLGINAFVFNAKTHALIGAFSLPQYSDIRKYVTYQGSTGSGIYATVANSSSNTTYGAEAFCSIPAFKTIRPQLITNRWSPVRTALCSQSLVRCPAKEHTLLYIRGAFTLPPGQAL